MKISFAVVADAANVTPDAKVNVLGVFTRFAVSDVPVQLPACSCVVILQPEHDDEGSIEQMNIKWIDPDAVEIFSQSFGVNLTKFAHYPPPPMPIIIQMQGLPIPKFGPHELQISCKDASHTLSIIASATEFVPSPEG